MTGWFVAWFAGWVVASLVFAALVARAARHRSLHPLLPLRFNFGKRRDTFLRTLELLSERRARILVETGTAREGLAGAKSQGASTVVFGEWARRNGAHLHSIDISPISIAAAEREVRERQLSPAVSFHQGDSVEFLESCDFEIDFLYLDSLDYSISDLGIQQASQHHHLRELCAAELRLHAGSVVLIDDCALPNGGKGQRVIEHLLKRGWKIERSQYQVLMVRDAP